MSLAAPLASSSSSQASASAPPYEATPLLLGLATLALCCFSPAILNDGDTWSHVAAGGWILDHRAVPHTDPFTFSFAHEWFAELLMGLAYRLAGWGGVTLLTGVAAGASVYLVARRVARDLTGPALAILMTLSLAMLAPSLLARPHILAFPCLAVWSLGLLSARDAGRAPPLALALAMTVWANLHGGFIFGLVLIAPFALDALLDAAPDRRMAAFRDWTLFGLVSVGAALVTPFGVEGLLFPLKLMNVAALAQIKEWQPESFAHPNALEIAMLGLLGLAMTRPVRVAPARAALLIGLLHMSLQHTRHEMLLAAIAPLLLAKPIADAVDAGAGAKTVARNLTLGALALALVIGGARLALPLARGDSLTSPATALEAVPADLRAKPVLNSYSFGGYLMHLGLRPFIDGRADMFGDAFLARYGRLVDGEPDTVKDALERYEIAWTVFSPNQKIVETLDHEPGWRRLYADKLAVIHVRDELRR